MFGLGLGISLVGGAFVAIGIYSCTVYKRGEEAGEKKTHKAYGEAVTNSDKKKEKRRKKEVKQGEKIIRSIEPEKKDETAAKILKLYDKKK